MTTSKNSRGERVLCWIERFCCEVTGRYRGQPMRLSSEQQAAILAYYDDGQEPEEPFRGVLGACLALVHLASGIAKRNECAPPPIETDPWTIWKIAELSPILHGVLQRHGSSVICPQLGTSFPRAA